MQEPAKRFIINMESKFKIWDKLTIDFGKQGAIRGRVIKIHYGPGKKNNVSYDLDVPCVEGSDDPGWVRLHNVAEKELSIFLEDK